MNDLVSSMKYTGRAVIDSGDELPCEIIIEQEMHQERTALPRQDKSWTFTDAAGHFHAVDEDGEYPTLDRRVEHRDCDRSCQASLEYAVWREEGDDCGGYDVTTYACSICGEDIKPGLLHGEHEFTVPGLKSWRAMVNGFLPPRQKLSLRFESERASFFGVAVVSSMVTLTSLPGIPVTELVGVSKLGRVSAR